MTPEQQYAQYARATEAYLSARLAPQEAPWPEHGIPAKLVQAMAYSVLAPGKRLRPVLLLASCEGWGGDDAQALPFAAAAEMIHAYSLIHDDLPCMDNDDLRRGQPTSHRRFGEGMALLAGDALLSEAFEMMAASPHPQAAAAIAQLALSAGARGMIAGQVADTWPDHEAMNAADMLLYIHRRKTADLFSGCIGAGLALAGAPSQAITAGREFGRQFGIAFQIIDDLLDMEGDAAVLGKTPGKDAAQNKLTWPFAHCVARARDDARAYIEQAVQTAQQLGGAAPFLRWLAQTSLQRVK